MSFRITSWATWYARSADGWWPRRRVVPTLTPIATPAGRCRRYFAHAMTAICSGAVGVGSRSSLPNRVSTAASVTGVRCRCSRRTSAAEPETPAPPSTPDCAYPCWSGCPTSSTPVTQTRPGHHATRLSRYAMKIDLPPDISGGDPAWLLDYLGLDVVQAPTPPNTTWVVSPRQVDLVAAQTLHGPALNRSRFDVSTTQLPRCPVEWGHSWHRNTSSTSRSCNSRPRCRHCWSRWCICSTCSPTASGCCNASRIRAASARIAGRCPDPGCAGGRWARAAGRRAIGKSLIRADILPTRTAVSR
jgi:hypothetical protein